MKRLRSASPAVSAPSAGLLNDARRVMMNRAGGGFVPSAARAVQPTRLVAARTTSMAALGDVKLQLRWDDYVLKEQIGVGATGKVYRAIENKTGRQVAVKFLRKPLVAKPLVAERFLRESQLVAGMAHPGIVSIHGAGRTAAGGLFLVLDLVRGQDLNRVVQSTRIDGARAAGWIAEAARTLHFVHERGIVHCDLKPSNLLLDDHERIYVTDFGLAMRVADLENTCLVGTPAFMAPEQVDGCWGAISPRTDVGGLGAVLLFTLTGKTPHSGADASEVLSQVVSAKPIRIATLIDEKAPPALVSILEKCLAKPPAHRIPSAQQLAEALTAASAELR